MKITRPNPFIAADEYLYHGTPFQNLRGIVETGLRPSVGVSGHGRTSHDTHRRTATALCRAHVWVASGRLGQHLEPPRPPHGRHGA